MPAALADFAMPRADRRILEELGKRGDQLSLFG